MEDEEGYTALHFPSRKGASGAASPAGKQDHRLCPRWHRIVLQVGWVGNIILVVAVIVMGVWALQLAAEKGKPRIEAGTSIGTCSVECKASLDNLLSRLRSRLCDQNRSSSSVNSTCKLCPSHWHLHRDKCYWHPKEIKSWNESRDDCSARNSQLVVIQNKEEMEFIKNITMSAQRYWIGLSRSPEKKWVWITGSQLDPNLFQEPKYAKGYDCGMIKNTIESDKCNAERGWVCEKNITLL